MVVVGIFVLLGKSNGSETDWIGGYTLLSLCDCSGFLAVPCHAIQKMVLAVSISSNSN
jgi:hypothetical protein